MFGQHIVCIHCNLISTYYILSCIYTCTMQSHSVWYQLVPATKMQLTVHFPRFSSLACAFWGSEVCPWKSKGAMAPLFLIGTHVWCTQRHGGFGSHGKIREVMESSVFLVTVWKMLMQHDCKSVTGATFVSTLQVMSPESSSVPRISDITLALLEVREIPWTWTDLQITTSAWICMDMYVKIRDFEFVATAADSGKLPMRLKFEEIDMKRYFIEGY